VILDPVFERFVKDSPLSVMARATLENVLPASALDDLFERTAETGYTRELLFSTLVDLMGLVVCGSARNVQAAFQRLAERIPVTLKSVYEKLQNVELPVSAALVRFTAARCRDLVEELGGACRPLLPGHCVKVLDGNHLAATQRRLRVTRGHSAGPLPGQSLVVLDPALMLVTDVFPCEDAYTQERALVEQVLPTVAAGEVWVEDRNFCTVDFLEGVAGRQAYFVVRRHANLTVEPEGDYSPELPTETGWVSERRVRLCRDGVAVLEARQVRVRLRQPTADGDREVEVLTNLPARVADTTTVALLYRGRWRIEGAFLELTVALKCEVNTLGYPKAALFAFCVALVAYNVLAVQKAALRSVHGEQKVAEEVSGYYVALEWSAVYAGMMIALPAEHWEKYGGLSAGVMASYLRGWARRVKLESIKKARRRPTKQKTQPIKDSSPHLSTARLLEEAKKRKAKGRRTNKHVGS
jgi:IS4 transposase